MAASKTRNPEAVGQRSGGQESDALMSYLAMVKDQCKPPVYSAFISLINAYHGNMLAVDALLGELFSLFYPRVFLLSGIKPLVDKSYHPRVDELCDKITRSSNSTSSSSSSDGSGDTGGVSGDISLPPSLGYSSDRSDRSVAFRVAMDVHSATPKPELGGGGGGGGGNHAIPGDRKSESTPLLSSVDSGGKDKRQSIGGGVKAGGSTGLKTNRSLVTSTSKSSSRRKAGDCYSTGRGRRNNDHDHDHDQELGTKPTKLW